MNLAQLYMGAREDFHKVGQLPATWRQRYRFRRYGADAGWQVGGTAQGDCAAGHPGHRFVQPGNGDPSFDGFTSLNTAGRKMG
jgi:hypothetical protein